MKRVRDAKCGRGDHFQRMIITNYSSDQLATANTHLFFPVSRVRPPSEADGQPMATTSALAFTSGQLLAPQRLAAPLFPAAARALTPPVCFRPRPTGSAPPRTLPGLHAGPLVPLRIDEANLLRLPDPGPLPPLRVDEADLLLVEDLLFGDVLILFLLLYGEDAVGAVDVVDAVGVGALDDVLIVLVRPRRTVSFPERTIIGGPPIGLGWPVELRTREGARNDGSASVFQYTSGRVVAVLVPQRSLDTSDKTTRHESYPVYTHLGTSVRAHGVIAGDRGAVSRRISPRRTGARMRSRRVGELGVAADVDVVGLCKKEWGQIRARKRSVSVIESRLLFSLKKTERNMHGPTDGHNTLHTP